jgi:hypothetical protein
VTIPARGAVLVKAEGLGAGESGYASVVTTAPVGATAIFSQFDSAGTLISEAGVGAATPMSFFSLPVDVSGDFNTGLAVANLASSTAQLYCKLLDESGRVVATRNQQLEAGKHLAIYVAGPGQLFPGIANLRGSLQVLSDVPVAATALRTTKSTLTALPVAGLNQPYQPVTLYFPQVVVGSTGSSYRTTIILTNTGFFPVSGTLEFTQSNGSPMGVTIAARSSAVHSFTIPAQGTAFFETAPAGTLANGYAIVNADHGLAGTLIFSQLSSTGALVTEAAVPASPRYSKFYIFAQAEEGFNTGFAVATPAASALLQYTLAPAADPTQTIEMGPVPLATNCHVAELIAGVNQLFPTFTGQGTLEVRSDHPVPAVTLRITARTMTALPVIPIP